MRNSVIVVTELSTQNLSTLDDINVHATVVVVVVVVTAAVTTAAAAIAAETDVDDVVGVEGETV